MKTGFIYIWYDKKRKMYYIGCHLGKEDDGYICSSNRMRDAFRRRPNDFKRRILKRDIPRDQLLNEEHKWLTMIKDEELGKKYYNLNKHHHGHWAININTKKSVAQKISDHHNSIEGNKKLSIPKLGNKNPMKRPEVIAKRLNTYMKREDRRPWNKGKILGPNPEHSAKMKGRISPNLGKKLSKESRDRISKQWKILYPCGKEEIITNLKSFCIEHNLPDSNMRKVALGKRRHCAGYQCFYTNSKEE